jgi:hypothetical protein
MPMKVHPSHTGEVTAARTGHAASASTATKASTSFASVLASTSTAAPAAITLRKGESLSAVDGHSYAEINGGKRDGLYVNTSNNKRRGQAFVLVHKNGREYHIYGTGKNRLVVALRKPDHADTPKTATTPANTAAGTGGTTPTVSAS